MPFTWSLAALACLGALASAQNCQNGAVDDGGNWYCSPVKQITYTGWAGSGSYNKVTKMDPASGTCNSVPYSYSGSMSPMDEEVSLHFRGPMQLKQFAFYSPSASSSKAKLKRHSHKHGHAHFHEHNKEVREARAHEQEQQKQQEQAVEARAVGDWVTVTMNGVAVSWINEYSGLTTTAASAAASTQPATTLATTTSAAAIVANINILKKSTTTTTIAAQTTTTVAAAAAASSSAAAAPAAAGSWTQEAYYNANTGFASGVTFLTHFGGTGSGVWDSAFGNSLSYASADGTAGSASPQVLKNTQLPSTAELVIMTDKSCTDGSCGYYRPGNVAYRKSSMPIIQDLTHS